MTITSLIAPVIGTIIGSCIGAGVSYLVARKTAQEAKAERERVEIHNEKLATYRAGMALTSLANAAAGYHLGSEKQITAQEAMLVDPAHDLWQIMKPISGRSADIVIVPDDLIVLWKAKKFAYISRIFFAIDNYNSMRGMVEEYKNRRDALFTKFQPSTMKGLHAPIELTEDQIQQLAPEIAVVRDLALNTRKYMKDVYEATQTIISEFSPTIRFYFDDPSFPVPTVTT